MKSKAFICVLSLLWPAFRCRSCVSIRSERASSLRADCSRDIWARRWDKRIFNFLTEKFHGKWRKVKDWKCAGERLNVEIIRFLSSLHFLLAIRSMPWHHVPVVFAWKEKLLIFPSFYGFYHMIFTSLCTILRRWCGIRLSQDERRNWKFSLRREQTKTIRLEVEWKSN